MAYQLQTHTWKVFGGSSDDLAVEQTDQKAAAVENFYRRRFRLVGRLGTQQIGTLENDGGVDGLSWQRINSTEYLLVAASGSIRNAFGTVTAAVSGSAGRFVAGTDVNFAWLDQRVYAGNGSQQNVYFDGSQFYQAMPDSPASGMTFAIHDFVGNVLPGTYQYAVTFLNQAGDYTVPTAISGSVTVVANGVTIGLSGIPTAPAGQDSAGRQIWRTLANGGQYFLVATISDNTTTTLIDNVGDSTVAGTSRLLFENTRFPPCQYLAEWNNRLCGAGAQTAEGDPLTIYISNVRQPWYCPLLPNSDVITTNGETPDPNQGVQLVIQDRSSAGVIGLHVHGGVLVCFTGGAGHLVQEVGAGIFSINGFSPHGCASHRTICSVLTQLLWLSWDGVYSWDGENVTRISDEEYNTFILENSQNFSKASAFVWENRYYLCFPDRTLIYDLTYQQWSTVLNASLPAVWSWRVTTTTVYTTDKKPRIYAAPVGLGQIWQAEIGSLDGVGVDGTGGQAIPMRWKSGDTDLGQTGPVPTQWPSLYFPAGGEGTQKVIVFLGAEFKAASGQTATINLYEGANQTIPFESNTWDLGMTTNQEVFVAVGDSQVSRYLDRVSAGCYGEIFAIEILVNATAGIELTQAVVRYAAVK